MMAEMPAGYDAWKTRSPDDDYPEEEEREPEPFYCDHEFDAAGFCKDCGGSRVTIAINEEFERAASEEWHRKMARRLLWDRRLRHVRAIRRWLLDSTLDFRLRLSARIWRVKWARKWTSRFNLIASDEEIPF